MSTASTDPAAPRVPRHLLSDARRSALASLTARPLDNVATGQAGVERRLGLVLAISLVALVASLLDFALIVGAVPIPVPGLRTPTSVADAATYGFETDAAGWTTRGVAANAVLSTAHVFAGRQALEFQVTNLSSTGKAFVFTDLPTGFGHNTWIVAHLYAPPGAPPLLASVYVLDRSLTWYSGPFPYLIPGQWTAVSARIPARVRLPVRELGLLILGGKGFKPYSGPLFLDAVNVQPR